VGTSGALRLAAKDGSCKPGETPLQWNVEGPAGPQGAPGVFSGDFRSPNGNFLLHVGDDGIRLASPSASVKLDAQSVSVNGMSVKIDSSANTDIQGTTVRLNGGCRSLIRSGDLTLPAAAPGAAQGAPIAIPPIPLGTGSSTVLAC
jgi:hypothetical protein